MKYRISGKKLEITEGLRTAVIESLNRLDKYFQEDVQVDVTMRVEKNRQIIEVKGICHPYRAVQLQHVCFY